MVLHSLLFLSCFPSFFLLKLVIITKNTPVPILDIFCSLKKCTCALFGLEKQPFSYKDDTNFKYKCPLWAICTPPLSNDAMQWRPKSYTCTVVLVLRWLGGGNPNLTNPYPKLSLTLTQDPNPKFIDPPSRHRNALFIYFYTGKLYDMVVPIVWYGIGISKNSQKKKKTSSETVRTRRVHQKALGLVKSIA